jgi:RNA polymerase sigma factor (sigma-70 family)
MQFVGVQSTGSGASSYRSRQDTDTKRSASEDYARFTSVVLPHLDAACNLAHWLTGNRTDAEDVVQDASLRAFRAIHKCAGGNARAWVLCIVRNTACSWLRKNRPTAAVTVEDLEAVQAAYTKAVDPDGETPEAALIAKTDAECLRAAIAALPTPFRETLVLRDIEGLDYREIAEATEVLVIAPAPDVGPAPEPLSGPLYNPVPVSQTAPKDRGPRYKAGEVWSQPTPRR